MAHADENRRSRKLSQIRIISLGLRWFFSLHMDQMRNEEETKEIEPVMQGIIVIARPIVVRPAS